MHSEIKLTGREKEKLVELCRQDDDATMDNINRHKWEILRRRK